MIITVGFLVEGDKLLYRRVGIPFFIYYAYGTPRLRAGERTEGDQGGTLIPHMLSYDGYAASSAADSHDQSLHLIEQGRFFWRKAGFAA